MRFASLPYDVARCIGTNCTKRETCARHRQIGRDAKNPDIFRVVMTDAARHSDECTIRIEELDDGKH